MTSFDELSFYGVYSLLSTEEEDDAKPIKDELGRRLMDPAVELSNLEKKYAIMMLEEEIRHCTSTQQKKKATLTELLSKIKQLPPTRESKLIARTEKKIKDAEKRQFELQDIDEKWKKGRHKFTSNTALQDFVRDLREIDKTVLKAKEKLEEIRRRKRRPEDDEDVVVQQFAPVIQRAPQAKRIVVKKLPKYDPHGVSANLDQQLRAKMVASLKNEADEKREEEEQKELVSVWDTKKAGPTKGAEKSAFDQSEFPSISATAPPGAAPPKAPRRKKEEDEEDKQSNESDDVPAWRPEPKSRSKAKAKEKNAPQPQQASGSSKKKKGKKEVQEKMEDKELEEAFASSSKSKKKGGYSLTKLLSFFRQSYQSTFLGGGDVTLLHTSPLGVPGKWNTVITLTWRPPIRQVSDGSYKYVDPILPRIKRNTKNLWPRYFEVLYLIFFLMSLSTIGLLAILTILQVVFSRIRFIPIQVHYCIHGLIWLIFIRSLYNLPVLPKLLTGVAFSTHVLCFT